MGQLANWLQLDFLATCLATIERIPDVDEPYGYYLVTQDSAGKWIAYVPGDQWDFEEFDDEAAAREFQRVALANYMKGGLKPCQRF